MKFPKLYPVGEVAKILNITPSQVRYYCQRAEIKPTHKVNRYAKGKAYKHRFYTLENIDALMQFIDGQIRPVRWLSEEWIQILNQAEVEDIEDNALIIHRLLGVVHWEQSAHERILSISRYCYSVASSQMAFYQYAYPKALSLAESDDLKRKLTSG